MHRRLRVNRSTRRHDGNVLESSVEFVILLKTDYGSAERCGRCGGQVLRRGNGSAEGCGRGTEVEHDVGLRTWLQLMCCALVPRTRCPLISEVEVERVKWNRGSD